MKKYLIVFASFLFLMSCSQDLVDEQLSGVESSLQKDINEIEVLDKGEIIPIEETELHRAKQTIAPAALNQNNSFFDLRDLDVNIIVKEGSGEQRYLQSQGTGKELILAKKNDKANQKFKLSFMPLTGYIMIKNNLNNLLSVGVYSNAPDTRVLYAKDNNQTFGACWDFLKGTQRDHSVILQNADAISSGSGGMWDIWYDCIGSNGTAIKFDKYRNSAKQEWEVRLVEPVRLIGSPQYFIDDAVVEQKPDYILRGTVTNTNSNPSTLTVQYSEGARISSNFSETSSFSVQLSMNMGVSTPFFNAGGGMVSTTTNGFTYGSSEEKNVSYMFNISVVVDPGKTVRVTAVVKNYNVKCRYKATVEGTSGRRVYLEGTWEGISCADVDYNIETLNSFGVVESTTTLKNPTARTIDLRTK